VEGSAVRVTFASSLGWAAATSRWIFWFWKQVPSNGAEHHDLEQVRALLGHTRIETTQVYAQIQPKQLKQAVNFYEAKALAELNQKTRRVF